MSDFDLDVLSVLGEAVVIARDGKIIFLNSPAEAILGGRCTGRPLSAVFGPEFVRIQARDYTANLSLNGKNCLIRSSVRNGEQILVLREMRPDMILISDAFLYSMRSSLMVTNLSAERVRRFAEETGSEEMLSSADSMKQSLASVSRLISNISDVCGIQAQTLRFSPKAVDVCKLFSEYTDIAASLLPKVKISFEAPAGLCASVDTDLIKHLFTNLISNAVLHGKCASLHIRLISSGDFVILAVNDDGCGISSETLYNVFERYRGAVGLAELSRGAGLGLSAVMGIARLHGGTVLLESQPGQGTAVHVSLKKNAAGSRLCSFSPNDGDIRDILLGLADCVDPMRFREAYEE